MSIASQIELEKSSKGLQSHSSNTVLESGLHSHVSLVFAKDNVYRHPSYVWSVIVSPLIMGLSSSFPKLGYSHCITTTVWDNLVGD